MTETIHEIALTGCTPEPLMSYLKALGILRLVSEQKDTGARGWWKNDMFWLRSSLDGEALVRFFLDEYRATPIVAPWAGGSGFFSGDNARAVNLLCSSNAGRCASYAAAIQQVRRIIEAEQITKKPKDNEKSKLIRRYRRELPDDVVAWMDAAMVLQQDGQGFSPLLGTGGNDGRLDFTQNFMQRIVAINLHKAESAGDESRMWLTHTLFASQARLDKASVGQFSPGRAGGPNATQGMKGDSTDNPWDFILMIEGTLLFAGAAVRRFGVAESAWATFPFTMNVSGVGSGSLIPSDSTKPKKAKRDVAEMWLPLWSRPSSLREVTALLAEGRANIGQRLAVTGVDMARAATELGVDRGISSFKRTIFLMRNGRNFLAIPAGSISVHQRQSVDLLRQIDPWLDWFRKAVGTSAKTHDKIPPRFASALRNIDSAIFDFCRYGGNPRFQRILVALGRAERELALTEGKVGNSQTKPKPLVGLSMDWINAADDNSPEFEIALALAGIYDGNEKIGPLRANLEPVAIGRSRAGDRYSNWAEKDRSVVWNAANLATNLANVLQRRVMDGQRQGCEDLPVASRFTASLDSVASFIEADLDDRRIEELIWGLMLIDGGGASPPRPSPIKAGDTPLPRKYALLKLVFLPRPLAADRRGDRMVWRLAREGESGITIRPEPRILPLLRAGRVGEACRIAAQRLRVSGLQPMPGPLLDGRIRNADWAEPPRNPRQVRRLAAALLVPIGSGTIDHLVQLVCRSQSAAEEAIATLAKGENQ